jgi:hypothetical protein
MSKKEMKYIGIDCGLDGGICELDSAGNLTKMIVMPTVKIGKGRKINLHELSELFKIFRGSGSCRFSIENPGGHAPSAAGLRSMTYSFAVVEAFLVCNFLTYHEFAARKWQSEFWSRPTMPKGKKFDTKSAALSEAKKLWPGCTFVKSDRSKKAHDGLVDAALIAEFGRRKF